MNNYQQFYQQLSRLFFQHPWWQRLLVILNSLIVLIMYCAYLSLLVWQLLGAHSIRAFASDVLIPGLGFGFLSIVRRWLNMQRPYEKWAIQPLIPRDGQGESMPSRHVFSAMTIALCVGQVNVIGGACLIFLACLLAVIRVIGGVHYPRDVIVGVLAGLVCGWITIVLIG